MLIAPTDTTATTGLTPHEAELAERLRSAVDQPAVVYARSSELGEGENGWRHAGPPADACVADGSLNADDRLLESAAASDTPVVGRCADGEIVAVALSERAVLVTSGSEAPRWVAKVLASEVAHGATASGAAELLVENESFVAQLASDLEELWLLRTMVERLSASRPDAGVLELAEATLPVLNTSVRTECLAYLETKDRCDPFLAEPAWVGGPSPQHPAVLRQIVERFGPLAKAKTLVRNWRTKGCSSAFPEPAEQRVVGVDSLVLTPLSAGPRFFGWLIAVNRTPSLDQEWDSPWQLSGGELGSGEASLLATTASILATQAANFELLREKEQLVVSVVRSMVSAIESKDQYTRGHSERVALYGRRLALELGYTDAEAENLYLTALLHDVGKIGVRDAVLQKAGRLTDEEFAEIARHPDEGWAILSGLQPLEYVLPGVLHHHERWDGEGYPDRLAGEAIPLDGRLLAVVDAFDAMTSDRPYRDGMPVEKAAAILRDGAGTQWDTQCVHSFFACFDDILRIKQEHRLPVRPTRRPASGRTTT